MSVFRRQLKTSTEIFTCECCKKTQMEYHGDFEREWNRVNFDDASNEEVNTWCSACLENRYG